jgi:hypothetical protein
MLTPGNGAGEETRTLADAEILHAVGLHTVSIGHIEEFSYIRLL